ncbi:30S ribosomal protein S18 [Dehalococcoidales bacterium]|nr:30S ribosomal protein S18 [Dehalococcoidales bacterium]
MAKAKSKKEKKWKGARYIPKQKSCSFCSDKVEEIDYKDPLKLRHYISERGKIEPRRRTGTCAKHQRVLAVAIKRARHLALLPFVPAHIYKRGIGN